MTGGLNVETFSIQQGIAQLVEGRHLNREQAASLMAQIMEGQVSQAQFGSLMTALRIKGETIEEVTGFAQSMRRYARKVATDSANLLDTCGTGGDGAHTFNISTASALVAAAGGIRVAKHGNRAASSKSGSADVLEALGVNIALDDAGAARCLDKLGICFMFAQVFHQSMKHAAVPRKEIGIRTVFNLLGPLTNPASADRQLLGVFDLDKTELMANVLRELGLKRGMVVASHDGLDEISISASTRITELKNGQVATYDLTPDDLGLRASGIEAITGGDAATNADIILSVLRGERGAYRDVVLANAGACFYVSERCTTLQEGVKLSAAAIDSGRAYQKLQELIQYTKELSHVS
ncbi:anthranilate phosphoribosyltransferase [Paenibacillus sp. YN15]|uniref:anthranilate phosphoribosyltransferase n=1 Tax=Paenibacillus sp. YN15 TaxID=1742774 RepID=UPI000DCE401E|nr:anthranilate phosphoribosyltransferase [Paenibacillus sp. YN15]RAU95572.1 anthranilate phosphoribosyltransferase [Paenibacillus sp. YN15]